MIYIKKRLMLIRYFLLIMLSLNIFRTYASLNTSVVTPLVLCPLIIANDIIRNTFKDKNSRWLYFSLVLSLIGIAAIRYYVTDFITSIYMLLYVIEMLYFKDSVKLFLLICHFILYLAPSLLVAASLNTTDKLATIGTSLITYLGAISILFLSHTVRKEREETEKLNEELKSSNIKLREYSLKVEELSIAKERQRVAQELHDSMGHSLMALSMHLDFAEKIFDKDPFKAKEVILKAKDISRKSTADLRMAVSTLKEERTVEDLRNAISELIEGFVVLGNIKINFSMDKALEDLNPDIKLCIYKTIRESLTNGIRHGEAATFDIDIVMSSNNAELTIKNNGLGCGAIIKSNGLKGIENRVSALGGTVEFSSSENGGFLTKAVIPIYEETKKND